MNTYDFFPRKEYNELREIIRNEYNDNYEEWNAVSAEKRDNIIMAILNNPAYKAFNECDMKRYFLPEEYKNIPDYNIWTKENHLKPFMSIDLKKANFQALKYHDSDIVFGCETYEQLLDMFDMPEYFKKSKYLRQVIFGKLNPKRATTIERMLMTGIDDLLRMDKKGNEIISQCELVGLKTDELVYSLDKYFWYTISNEDLRYIEKYVYDCLGIEVRVDTFQVIDLNIYNVNGNSVSGFVKSHCFPSTDGDELKCVSTLFFPQVYKIWKRKEITEMDKVFFCEGQLATFNNNLIKRYL